LQNLAQDELVHYSSLPDRSASPQAAPHFWPGDDSPPRLTLWHGLGVPGRQGRGSMLRRNLTSFLGRWLSGRRGAGSGTFSGRLGSLGLSCGAAGPAGVVGDVAEALNPPATRMAPIRRAATLSAREKEFGEAKMSAMKANLAPGCHDDVEQAERLYVDQALHHGDPRLTNWRHQGLLSP
jgi:hypothetical protein